MSASPAPTQSLRALPTLGELPPGCIAQTVTDDASWPHLLPGEFAVVDTADRIPAHGELFVIRYADPRSETGHVAHIVEIHRRPCRDEPGAHRWWAAPYVRPRSVEELAEWIEEGRPLILSQGPFAPRWPGEQACRPDRRHPRPGVRGAPARVTRQGAAMIGASPRPGARGRSLSLRRLLKAVAFMVRMRLSEWRFRRHRHAQARHDREAVRHMQAMVAEMKWRGALIARYGRLPRHSAPRSGSGIPLVPLSSGWPADPS